MSERKKNRPARPEAAHEVPVGPDATSRIEAEALVEASARADAAEARADELDDRLKRALADFRNETQRIARQADEGRKYAVDGLVQELIPVLDALHSAREGLAQGSEEAGTPLDAVRQGLDLVEKELLTVLGRHGVERIEAAASPFDPGLHEAVFVVDHPELEPNTVAQVLRPGFTLHGRVVRPAHVSVTRSAQTPPPGTGSGDPEASQED